MRCKQQNLMSERQLKFHKALEMAQAMEAAAENIHDLCDPRTEKACTLQNHHTPPLQVLGGAVKLVLVVVDHMLKRSANSSTASVSPVRR